MSGSRLLRWLPPVLLALLVLATFRDYGYSWDETWQNRWYGQAVIRFITTAGADRSATDTNNFYLYGGTFDVAAELLVAASPLEPRNARHLANALAGLAGMAGCWFLARRLGGRTAAAWAALFLAASAPWYGHMFINAKDIPFAAGYVWSLFLALRALDELPRPRFRTSLLLGVVLGLTLGVRIGGVLVFAYLLLFTAAFFGWRLLRREDGRAVLPDLPRVAASLLTVAVVAWLVMLAFWPAALLRPLAIPLEAYRAANSFKWIGALLWNGRVVMSNDLPWDYLPVLFAVLLPEVLALLFGASLVWGIVRCARGWGAELFSGVHRGVALSLVAALFPVVWAVGMGSVLYDNGRHFLFVLPPLACLAGLCWSWLLEEAERRRAWLRPIMTWGLACALAVPALRMASLHPYEYAYLNSFAGGMPEGGRRFDTDYWITSYREASRKLVAHAEAVARAAGRPFALERFTVALVGPPEILAEELPQNFTVVPLGTDDRADYLLLTTRWNADQQWPDWPEVAAVERAGMRFAVVRAAPGLAQWTPSSP